MNPVIHLSAALLAGILLGGFYFRHLRSSLDSLLENPRPVRGMLFGFAVRLSAVTAGFLLVASGSWERMLAALLGFILARGFLIRRWGSGPAVQS
ncbi:MAG: ATP synthase subunit I [Syntrophales bacterium]|nr:ATP synthase subunit I [Syntrophales bacterium]MDD5533269.1 ATP synthase subunit I [Syntrophales bacterium]